MLDAEDPQRFARIINLLREGDHEVGIHGLRCKVSSNLLRRILALAEVEDLETIKQNFTGLFSKTPTLYRPHGFQLGRKLIKAIKSSGLQLVLGSSTYQIGQGDPSRSYLKAFERAKPRDRVSRNNERGPRILP